MMLISILHTKYAIPVSGKQILNIKLIFDALCSQANISQNLLIRKQLSSILANTDQSLFIRLNYIENILKSCIFDHFLQIQL